MKRKIVVVVALALLLCAATGAFAFEQKSKVYPWMASFNKTGQINLYAAIGYYYVGFDVAGGLEVILGNFDLSGIPLEWGLAARGLLGFGSFSGASWMDWGAAPMVTLHWGVDFGSPWRFDWYIGLGLGFYGTTGSYYSFGGNGPFIGFASSDGLAWHFADNFSLILDYSYVGWTSVYGIGLRVDL